jgi:hypothetical protein
MADNGLGSSRRANTMLMADESITRSSRLTASCATGIRSRSIDSETRVASGSRIRNSPGSPFQDIGRLGSWGTRNDSADWNREIRAGHGDNPYESSFDDDDDDDTVKMSTWAGQPKVEGSSETVRMFLLTCVSIGITSVHTHCAGNKSAGADSLSVASPGVSR